MSSRRPLFSRRIGRFQGDRRALIVLIIGGLLVAARAWLAQHPEHNPFAPLDLRDPAGWATTRKVQAVIADPLQCRAVLARSDVRYSVLPPDGEGDCARTDRTRLDRFPLTPAPPPTTCGMAIALERWRQDTLEPQARAIFGQGVRGIAHLGAYSCRRVNGRATGNWSEHATGNAIDIAGVVLMDGTRISVLADWDAAADDPNRARYLRLIRDGACRVFSTTLGPDYNAAHRDHLHLDMAARSGGWGGGVCR